MNECWAYDFEERPCFSILENQIQSMMQEERENSEGY